MKFLSTKQALLALADSLATENNEILQLADTTDNEEALNVVAQALVESSLLLQKAASKLDDMFYEDIKTLSPEAVESLAALAEEFDKSDDPFLQKQASVFDQILLSLAAPKDAHLEFKKSIQTEIERLKQARRDHDAFYNQPKVGFDPDKMRKAVNEQVKEYKPLETALNTRTCPDHPGAQIQRIDDQVYQCALDKKVYNYRDGFTTMKGNKVPGGSVDLQTKTMDQNINYDLSFSTRSDKMSKV